MYQRAYFKPKQTKWIDELIQNYPFATLVVSDGESIETTQLPVLLVHRGGKQFLQGHVVNKSGHHQLLLKQEKALLIFHGPHTYISASWYVTPQVASTWNYANITVRGPVKIQSNAWTMDLLDRLTQVFEPADSPALVAYMSAEYMAQNLQAITGFEMEVEQVEAVFKLSQNRPEQDRKEIIKHLRDRGDENSISIAEMMARNDQD